VNTNAMIAAMLIAATTAAMPASAAISDLVIDADGNYVVPAGTGISIDSAFVVPAGKKLIVHGSLALISDESSVSFADGAILEIAHNGTVYVDRGTLTLPANQPFDFAQGAIRVTSALNVPSSTSLNLTGGNLLLQVDSDVYLNGGALTVSHQPFSVVDYFPDAPGARIHGNLSVQPGDTTQTFGLRITDGTVVTGDLDVAGDVMLWNENHGILKVNGDALFHDGKIILDYAGLESDRTITFRNSELRSIATTLIAPEIVFESDVIARFDGRLEGNVRNSGDFSRSLIPTDGYIHVIGNFTQDEQGILRLSPERKPDLASAMDVEGILSLDGKLFIRDTGLSSPDGPFVYDFIIADEIDLAPTLEIFFETEFEAFWGLVDLDNGREAFRVSFGMGAVQGAVNPVASNPTPIPLPPAAGMFPLAAGVAWLARRRLKMN
jgi:hypothetical protein